MSDDTPTVPVSPIPSSAGIVAVAGHKPLAKILDLNGDGIPDVQQYWFWDRAIQFGLWLAGQFAPNNSSVLMAKGAAPEVEAILKQVTK